MIVNNVCECFSHIPYTHNNKYTHLPQNEKFCVKNKSGTISKISELYSRIIFEKMLMKIFILPLETANY